ncbi:MAG: DnaA regulatory inactivator Hda [Burkholderiales bacterium]
MRQLVLDINPGVTPTLDNFVVGRNAEAVDILRLMLDGSLEERFVYLWGEKGSGKTHLLRAMVSTFSAGKAVYRLCEVGMGFGAVPDCDLLLVDNVQSLTDNGQVSLFNVYNDIREGSGMLVVTGDAAPAELNVRDDLKTRLAWGLAYQLHELNEQETAGALKRHAHARGMSLSDEVVKYLFSHWKRDLPSLLVALDRLDEYSLETKRPVSVPLLKQALAVKDFAQRDGLDGNGA